VSVLAFPGTASVSSDREQRRVDRWWRESCAPLAGMSLSLDAIYDRVRTPTPDQRLRLSEQEAVHAEER
jgi:hypothetical protein